MILTELLREIENRGVTLFPAGNRLRFRPKANLTPELVEGLREHKEAILERLEGGESPEPSRRHEVTKGQGDHLIQEALKECERSRFSEPTIRDAGEVLQMARARLGSIDPEHQIDAPYPEPEPGRDPLVHKHTAKARFFQGVRRRDLKRRERDGLPPWIRIVDGGTA